MTELVTTTSDLRGTNRSGETAVVMTMGALHAGHVQLMHTARELVGPQGTLIVTVFVNPTQFGAGEDFGRYPRTMDDDVAACEAAGVDIVFAPTVVDVYGNEHGFLLDSITIDPGPLGELLEGAARPGHFRGMLTVVAKLLAITAPDVALFGQKDYQQLVLISRMVADLNLPVRVVGVPIVREPEGLAMSSRNRYLSTRERAVAALIPQALNAAVAAAPSGSAAALAAARAILDGEPGIEVDYLAITDPALAPAPISGPSRILVAARVGSTRLIDNVECWLGES